NQIDLIGYDLDAGAVTLYWRARSLIQKDYTVFVHVVDHGGAIIAQSDGQLRRAAYPTSFWRVGEVVRDDHRLQLLSSFWPLRLGLYLLDSGERLPLVGQNGDAVVLV